MIHNIIYETERLRVVPLDESHIEQLRVLRNASRHCFFANEEISSEQQKKWFESYKSKEGEWMFAAYLKDGSCDTPIGFAGIMLTDAQKQIADVGRIVVDTSKTTQKGMGREFYVGLLFTAFEKIDVKTMISHIVNGNERSEAMCRAVGCDVQRLEDGTSKVTLTKEMLLRSVDVKVKYFD